MRYQVTFYSTRYYEASVEVDVPDSTDEHDIDKVAEQLAEPLLDELGADDWVYADGAGIECMDVRPMEVKP